MSKLSAFLCPTTGSKLGTEGYIQDAITLSKKFPFDWSAELPKDTKQWSNSGKSFDFSFIPSFDYVSASSKHVHYFKYFRGLSLPFRWFEMLENRDFMTMLANRSLYKNHWFLGALGSAKHYELSKFHC